MTNLTTKELKDLLGMVTPGEWCNGKRWQSIIADGKTGHDDDMSVKAYGGHLICESVASHANATLIALAPTLAAEVVELREVLQGVIDCLSGEPEYHYQCMGCGLEDRNIHDRYESMKYGWDQAMERVYSEHINGADDIACQALSQK